VNEAESQILNCLIDAGDDFGYLSFADISSRTGLERKIVRRACRALARKGLAAYGRGLFNDDGEVAGSGYTATRQARSTVSHH